MRYLNLWCTELPPVIDVTVGPINGAARPEQAEGVSTDSVVGAIASEGVSLCRPAEVAAVAAAPPEPTPANSEGAADTTTPSNEGPGTEREGEAWVPWEGGAFLGARPVPLDTRVIVKARSGIIDAETIAPKCWTWVHECSPGDIIAYRLANPTPRGPCRLPAYHPHAALERLWRSDDTLMCWKKMGARWLKVVMETPAWFAEYEYHVGHVPPKGAA